jgi:hypothetical protein
MPLNDKNIVITANTNSSTDDPKIVFSGATSALPAQNITMYAYPYDGGTVSFEGSAGQLFSISNTMSGTLYSVNDVSGIPSLEIMDTGKIKLGEYYGNILLGTDADTGLHKLQVNGSVLLGNTTSTSSAPISLKTISLGGLYGSGAAGTNGKLKLWEGPTGYAGFGMNSTSLEYIGGSNLAFNHIWYTNGIQQMKMSTAGTFSVGTIDQFSVTSAGAITATTTNLSGTATISNATGISLTNAGSNLISYNTAGASAPTYTTRSAGTKIVFYPSLSPTNADYAIGIESNTLWMSVGVSGNGFKWYAGTTNIASLLGTGKFGINKTTPTYSLEVIGDASIGGATDKLTIEADGSLKLNGNATQWGDIDFPMIVRNTGAGIPVQTTFIGNITMPLWQVNDYIQADSQELPHNWKEASPLQWHIHIVTNTLDGTDRYVSFNVEYTWANRNSAFINSIIVTGGELLIPANTPAKTHLIFNIGSPWTPSGGTIAAYVKARLIRVTAVGATPTNHPFCDMLQLHYEIDSFGSRQITTK